MATRLNKKDREILCRALSGLIDISEHAELKDAREALTSAVSAAVHNMAPPADLEVLARYKAAVNVESVIVKKPAHLHGTYYGDIKFTRDVMMPRNWDHVRHSRMLTIDDFLAFIPADYRASVSSASDIAVAEYEKYETLLSTAIQTIKRVVNAATTLEQLVEAWPESRTIAERVMVSAKPLPAVKPVLADIKDFPKLKVLSLPAPVPPANDEAV